MHSKILCDETTELDLEKLEKLKNPFTKDTDTGTVVGGFGNFSSIDITFTNISQTFFESSYVYLGYVLKNRTLTYGDLEVLNILHNLIIGVELSLKANLSAYRQLISDEWMFDKFDIEHTHRLGKLIGKIRECAKSAENGQLQKGEFVWINRRLKIIEKFVEFTEEKGLNFQSTRYPINSKDKAAQYIESDINIDLVILGEWIEILYKACEELFYVYDMLDNARSSVDYDFYKEE